MYEAQQNVARIAMEEANLKKMKAQREEQAEKQKTASTPQAQPQAQPQNQIQEPKDGHKIMNGLVKIRL